MSLRTECFFLNQAPKSRVSKLKSQEHKAIHPKDDKNVGRAMRDQDVFGGSW